MRNFFLWNLCQSTMEATFVNNQKGGLHLQDQNCFRYRIHHKSETKATYRCVKRDSLKCKASAVLLINQNKIETFINEHNHESSIASNVVRDIENTMIKSAASIGNATSSRATEEIRSKICESDHPELMTITRKNKAIAAAIYRAKKRREMMGWVQFQKRRLTCTTLFHWNIKRR